MSLISNPGYYCLIMITPPPHGRCFPSTTKNQTLQLEIEFEPELTVSELQPPLL